jgi:hypothetical protein
MRGIVALVILAACVAPPSRVRGIDGTPLPTTAIVDADVPPIDIDCGGTHYLVVAAPHAYFGTHVGTERPFVHDAALMCARIRAH